MQEIQRTHAKSFSHIFTPYLTVRYKRNYLDYQKTRYYSIIYPEKENKPPRFLITYRNKYMVGNTIMLWLTLHKLGVVHINLAAKQAAVPICVHTVHNVAEKELSMFDRILAKKFYKKYQVIPVALSELIQKTIINVYGGTFDSIPVILNGINLSNCVRKDN